VKWLRNLKLTKKIIGFVLLSVLAMLAIGFNFAQGMNNMTANMQSMYEERMLPVEWLGTILANQKASDADTLDLLLSRNVATKDKLKAEIEQRNQKNDELMKKFESNEPDDFEKGRLEQLKTFRQQYVAARQKISDLVYADRNEDAYQAYVTELQAPRDQVEKVLEELVAYNQKEAEQINASNEAEVKHSANVSITITAVAAILFLVIGYALSRMVTKPLSSVQQLMVQAEAGDLTVRGEYLYKDEVGQLTQSFNRMMNGLQDTVHQIYISSLTLASTAEQLSASSEGAKQATDQISRNIVEVADGADMQLRQAEESARSMEEMASGVTSITDRAIVATEASSDASVQARHGSTAVDSAVRQMESIRASVGESQEVIGALNRLAQDIEQIVGAITDIARQTNLLALNAAIEAARAGEQGKGFAVVADEVRKLAEESSVSAEQIRNLIADVQTNSLRSVEAMDKVTSDVHSGIEIMSEVGVSFSHIVLAIENVAEQIQEVSATSQQMSAAAQEVSASVSEMAGIARDSAGQSQNVAANSEEQLASVEEISDSAVALARMAEELQDQVNKFQV
jgi:methyl-accepting chemotaxis protein